MRVITVFLFLCFIFTTGIVWAQTTPSVVADEIATGSPLYYNHTPNIARTSDGQLIAVWKSADNQVVFSKYDDAMQATLPIRQASRLMNPEIYIVSGNKGRPVGRITPSS